MGTHPDTPTTDTYDTLVPIPGIINLQIKKFTQFQCHSVTKLNLPTFFNRFL